MTSISRALLLTALIGVILACVGGLLADGKSTREVVLRGMATRSLDELALLAGVAGDEGELLRDDEMAVEVVADGGPTWGLTSVEAAVDHNRYFAREPSRHILRAEVIEEQGAMALQLHLWRAGWELREPEPSRARIASWTAVLGGVLGAVVALFVGRISVGLASAGLIAQVALALDPIPRELFPPRRLTEVWASGPLVLSVSDAINDMGTIGFGLLFAVLAGCFVLVGFDHKRTRGGEDDLGLSTASLTALLGTVGVLAWLEAAGRASLFAACDVRVGAFFGLLVFVGLILAWLPAIGVARESWRT